MIIGTTLRNYNADRNFEKLQSDTFSFQRTYDIFVLPRRAEHHLKLKLPYSMHRFIQTMHCDLGLNKADVMHFFNGLSVSKKPWVTTFEHGLPLWNHHSRFGFKLLASDYCKKMIAMSQNAYDIQCHYLKTFPEYSGAVKAKMLVLHPPQKLCISNYDEKVLDGQAVTMTLVGADFFRKGGLEVLLAIKRLLDDGESIRLNIVSSMQIGDYASYADEGSLQIAWEIIQQYPQQIFHRRSLSNEEVIDLFRQTHVGLLPSYADTYGYSVLEAQACGCPVVTTNIRAMPEINNDASGWVIDVPKDHLGNAIIETPEERRAFSELLQERLYAILKEICGHPAQIQSKGEKAIQRIATEHDPAHSVEVLKKIYREALDR